MEILLYCSVGFFLFLGVIGSIVPVLPGPFLSYIALLLYHFFIISINIYYVFLIGLVMVMISLFDYFLQIYGVKKVGGGKYAIRGSLLGMILGVFLFPPFGILIGAFVGAYIGAKIELKNSPVKIAFGALWGYIVGAILKLFFSIYLIYFLFF